MIRPITPADRDTYLALSGEFYQSPAVSHPIPAEHRTACFDEMLRSDAYAECLLLESEGEAVGYALLAKTYSQEAGGLVIWIEELYLRPAMRGKGLGTRFFGWLIENRPAKRYRLEVEPENEGAVRLYRAMGFVDAPYGGMWKE